MIHLIWSVLMMFSIVFGIVSGNSGQMTEALMEGAKEAVNLCIVMAAVVGLWSGMMEIAVAAGAVERLADWMRPFLSWLFPGISKRKEAMSYIAANFSANLLGLGWAATPAGIKAMEEMAGTASDTATDEMCTFIIMNVSSLQLVPLTMIAYRSQYGSVNPSFILVPGLLATAVSTITAIIYCKWKISNKKRGK